MNDDIIIVASQGTNEITIGDNSKLMVVKKGEERSLTVKSDTEPRWVWIATEYIEAAKKILSGQKFEEWGEWDSKNADKVIDKYGIFKQYVIGKGVSTKIGQDDIILKGTIYYFEAFREVPTLERGHYVATIDKPKILSAYFAQSKDAYKYPGEAGTSQVYTYKSSLKLYVLSHLIPDYTKPYHNFALFEVTIWNCENDKEVTTEPLQFYQKTIDGKFTVNTLTELDFIIDEKWRDNKNVNHTEGIKEYYAKIKTTIYTNEDAVKGSVDENGYLINANENPSNRGILKSTNKFNAVSPNNEEVTVTFTSEDEAASKYKFWWFFEGRDVNQGIHNASNYKKTTLKPENYMTKGGQVLEDQQVTFKVRYETMDVILDQYEAKKNNMFAVVGDIEYTSLNHHPCKYSKITIEHKSRPKPFVLFDEDAKTKKVVDHTDLVFGIVAGDVEESITIKAEGLAIQSYQAKGIKPPIVCDGITTTRKIRRGKEKNRKRTKHKQEEFIHNTIEDVFNMKSAYVLFPENRMITTGQENMDTGEKTIDISSQGLDYKTLDNGIELKTGYLYNKNYDTKAEEWLGDKFGNFTNDLIDIAWIVRYFKLDQNRGQKYYIPIGTCRYPNQLAKIEVFPDVEWWINVKYNAKNPKHVYQTPNYGYRVITTEKYQNQKNSLKYATDRQKMKVNDYELQFEAGFKYNGETIKFNSGDGFPLINAINFFLKAYEVFKKITFADETKEKESTIAKGTEPSSRGALEKKMTKRHAERKGKGFPFRIEVYRPSFSGGIYGSYKQSKNDINRVGGFYEVKYAAEPLFGIEGKLDLLYFAQFIGPIGQALDKISKVVKKVDYLTLGAVKIDYFLDLAAEVKLNLDISRLNYHTIDGWGGGELNAHLPIKVWLESGVNVDVNLKGVATLDADATIRGEANMDIQITLDKRNNKLPMEFTFNGLDVMIWLSLNVKSNKEGGSKKNTGNQVEEPKEKPDAIKRLIAPGKPYRFDIL